MYMDKINKYVQLAIYKAVFFSPKIFLAALIIRVEFKVARKLVQWSGLAFEKQAFQKPCLLFIF